MSENGQPVYHEKRPAAPPKEDYIRTLLEQLEDEKVSLETLDRLQGRWEARLKEESSTEDLRPLIRATQILTVGDYWHRLPQENKARMAAAVSKVKSETQSFERLRQMTSENPWQIEDIVAVLVEKGDQIKTNPLLVESQCVFLARAVALVRGGLLEAAANLTSFAIANHKSNLEWDRAEAAAFIRIVAMHVELMVRLKRTSNLSKMVFKTLSWPKLLELLDVQLEGLRQVRLRLFPGRIEEEAREMTLIAGIKLLLSAQDDGAAEGEPNCEYVRRLRAASGSNGASARNHLVAAVADVFQASCRVAEPFYSFATELWRQFGGKSCPDQTLLSSVVQLLLRGLSMDINALEEGDVKVGQKEIDKTAIESRMSSAFLLLSDEALPACPAVARECLLTAFSLRPSPELLLKLKSVATAGGDDGRGQDGGDNAQGEGRGQDGSGRRNWSKVRAEDGGVEMFDMACEKLVEDLKDYKGEEVRKKHEGGGMLGIAAIQAKSVTSLASYDPMACPLSPYLDGWPKCLPHGILRDLLVVTSCPRWHLLTWTVGWAELEQRAQELLRDVKSSNWWRRPKADLKYLVIDYTQFDEWSSDEEAIDESAGIETGYEIKDDDDDNADDIEDVAEGDGDGGDIKMKEEKTA